jgi:hypothetical protein
LREDVVQASLSEQDREELNRFADYLRARSQAAQE